MGKREPLGNSERNSWTETATSDSKIYDEQVHATERDIACSFDGYWENVQCRRSVRVLDRERGGDRDGEETYSAD